MGTRATNLPSNGTPIRRPIRECARFWSLVPSLRARLSLTVSMSDKKLPSFDELPNFHEYTGCAWEVWGKGDELGTVNLLTAEVVAEAAKEIKCVYRLVLAI